MIINEGKSLILLTEGFSIFSHFLWEDMSMAVNDHGGSVPLFRSLKKPMCKMSGDPSFSFKTPSGSSLGELRLPFCETIMAETLSEIPIFVCTRTEDQREGLRDIDSIFLLLDFFLNMEGNDLPQKEIVTP